MDTVGIADIQQLDESELEELLQQAIDPLVPVELFYAVLDRIGQLQLRSPLQPVPFVQAQPDELPPSPILLPDASELMEQVDFLEAAMSGE